MSGSDSTAKPLWDRIKETVSQKWNSFKDKASQKFLKSGNYFLVPFRSIRDSRPNSLANLFNTSIAYFYSNDYSSTVNVDGESQQYDLLKIIKSYPYIRSANFMENILEKNYPRLFNFFHHFALILSAPKNCVIAFIDYIDRCFFTSDLRQKSSIPAMLAKAVLGGLLLGLVEFFAFYLPFKILGDLLDFFLLDRIHHCRCSSSNDRSTTSIIIMPPENTPQTAQPESHVEMKSADAASAVVITTPSLSSTGISNSSANNPPTERAKQYEVHSPAVELTEVTASAAPTLAVVLVPATQKTDEKRPPSRPDATELRGVRPTSASQQSPLTPTGMGTTNHAKSQLTSTATILTTPAPRPPSRPTTASTARGDVSLAMADAMNLQKLAYEARHHRDASLMQTDVYREIKSKKDIEREIDARRAVTPKRRRLPPLRVAGAPITQTPKATTLVATSSSASTAPSPLSEQTTPTPSVGFSRTVASAM